jgi:hypothetical protein
MGFTTMANRGKFIAYAFGVTLIAYYICSGSKAPPAFTLDFLFFKAYVINSSKLVAVIQRHHRTISFDRFLTTLAKRMLALSEKGYEAFRDSQSGGGGVTHTVLNAMHSSLLGEGLDKMNRTMMKNLELFIDEVAQQEGDFDLYKWCEHTITLASTNSVYGRLNPYKSKVIEEAFW